MMTIRQKLLKAIYPLLMKLSKKKTNIMTNEYNMQPATSFYNLSATLNVGTTFHFEQLKGKNVLIVNTASNCGYTNQYEGLQKLYEQYKNKLVILGFPSNDFKEQEKGTDEEIAQFCKVNYGVAFPIMQKSNVIKSVTQNSVLEWLSNATLNGWNNNAPSWNFCKYLINTNGALIGFYEAPIEPLDSSIVNKII
jgi:glutathione peroxidase